MTDSYCSRDDAFDRFCSADLPDGQRLFNARRASAPTVRIYLTGEEDGTEGRAFATVVNGAGAGTAYELPFLGNMSYENVVANPLRRTRRSSP